MRHPKQHTLLFTKFFARHTPAWGLAFPLGLSVAGFSLLTVYAPISIDSGVFMLAGEVVGEEGSPYLNLWDHKGPLLYGLNSLGLSIAGIRGVIASESLLICCAIAIAGFTWITAVPSWSVPVGLTLLVISFFMLFEGGNFSETWTMSPALVAYAALTSCLLLWLSGSLKPRRLKLSVLVCSVAVASCIFIRPNNSPSLALGVIALLIVLKSDEGFGQFVSSVMRYCVLPFLFISLCSLAVLKSPSVLGQMIDQYLLFNFANSEGNFEQRAENAGILFAKLFRTPLGVAAILAAGFALTGLIAQSKWPQAVALLAVVSLVFVDSAAALLSGRAFLHYLVAVLPALTALFVVGWVLLRSCFKESSSVPWLAALTIVSALLLFVPGRFGGVTDAASAVADQVRGGLYWRGSPLNRSASYLDEAAGPDRSVFILGPGHPQLLVGSKLRTPSRLVYLWHLGSLDSGLNDLSRKSLQKEVTDDVIEQRPQLILWSADECPFSRGLEGCDRSDDKTSFSVLKLWILRNYKLVGSASEENGLTRFGDFELWKLTSK